jgi:hypothetical protein
MTLLKLELFDGLNQQVLVVSISFGDVILLSLTAQETKILLPATANLAPVAVLTEEARDEISIEDL